MLGVLKFPVEINSPFFATKRHINLSDNCFLSNECVATPIRRKKNMPDELAEFNKKWDASRPKKDLPRGDILELDVNTLYKVEIRDTRHKEGKFPGGYEMYMLGDKSPMHPNGVFFLSHTAADMMNEHLQSKWTDRSKPAKVLFLLDEVASKKNDGFTYFRCKCLPGNW
jgi:hypothetical protein